ncbi:MAG: hypothetical protein M3067_06975 [Chloroflexota bacterium]|nr:hypothetical protein [Chloroflexota bacterium]
MPSAYPGGPSHKAGTPIYVATVARDLGGLTTGFITASPAALALSAARSAAEEGERLRPQIAYEPVSASPHGPGYTVTHATTPVLYDFFEAGFVAVTLSYLALEAFANWVIADRLSGKIHLQRHKKVVGWDADDAQRHATLDEKIREVLPTLTGITAPARTLLDRLDNLNRVRDDTVHLNGRDAYPRSEEPLTGYFHRLLALDLRTFPRTSVDVMLHFTPEKEQPGWLTGADNLTARIAG